MRPGAKPRPASYARGWRRDHGSRRDGSGLYSLPHVGQTVPKRPLRDTFRSEKPKIFWAFLGVQIPSAPPTSLSLIGHSRELSEIRASTRPFRSSIDPENGRHNSAVRTGRPRWRGRPTRPAAATPRLHLTPARSVTAPPPTTAPAQAGPIIWPMGKLYS